MNISPARPQDLPDVMTLLSSCVRQMLSEGIDQWDEIYPDEATCAGDIERHELFLLERDSCLGGIITLSEYQEPAYRDVSWHYSGKALVVHCLAVDPVAKGKGYARELMRFACEFARQQRYATIRLDAFAGNPRAVALYERLGYRRAESVLFRKGVFWCFEIQVGSIVQERRTGMRYPVVMFDWGDTIMKDDPALNTPMYQWPIVEAVDGAEEVLSTLHPQRTIVMATGAAQSDEADIRRALERVKLNTFFDHIFCFKNSGFRKPAEDFYRHIVNSLNVEPSDILMVGDNFESDVLAANRVGISGVWLNNRNEVVRVGDRYRTIYCLHDLLLFLENS